MGTLLEFPHRTTPGMCPVNGIRDLVQWRSGRDWSSPFVHGLGLGGGFAYLRVNVADPPRQVYWGNASPRQHKYLAELFGAEYFEVENRTFKFSWRKAQEAVDAGTPPIIGPLDMYYLHFYEGLYQRRHIPIHYLLLVGYDDEKAYVLDTGQEEVQALPLEELELAWNVNTPGLGKRNRLAVLDIPEDFAPTKDLIRRSIRDECQVMLEPPVSMLGIPAMQKVAREIASWPDELGREVVGKCLDQVREYLNSPPDLEGNHLTAGRDLYIAFLEEAAELSGLDFSQPASHLKHTIEAVPRLAGAIRRMDLEEAAQLFDQIASQEQEAFKALSKIVGEPGAAG
jgi:hypothetical protein